MGGGCVGQAELLLHHAVYVGRVFAHHHFGKLCVGHGDAEVGYLLVEELFSDHGIEHLLLEHGVVDALAALLGLL